MLLNNGQSSRTMRWEGESHTPRLGALYVSTETWHLGNNVLRSGTVAPRWAMATYCTSEFSRVSIILMRYRTTAVASLHPVVV